MLITRRTPRAGELAWALRRYELGCERPSPFEALTDHPLALRALLEPRARRAGASRAASPRYARSRISATYLRALLRDVLCGHLDSDLSAVADRLLVEAGAAASQPSARPVSRLAGVEPDSSRDRQT